MPPASPRCGPAVGDEVANEPNAVRSSASGSMLDPSLKAVWFATSSEFSPASSCRTRCGSAPSNSWDIRWHWSPHGCCSQRNGPPPKQRAVRPYEACVSRAVGARSPRQSVPLTSLCTTAWVKSLAFLCTSSSEAPTGTTSLASSAVQLTLKLSRPASRKVGSAFASGSQVGHQPRLRALGRHQRQRIWSRPMSRACASHAL